MRVMRTPKVTDEDLFDLTLACQEPPTSLDDFADPLVASLYLSVPAGGHVVLHRDSGAAQHAIVALYDEGHRVLVTTVEGGVLGQIMLYTHLVLAQDILLKHDPVVRIEVA
jgi:hypothetical protein